MSATIPVLGVDPGHDGAAVLLSGTAARHLASISWKRLERKGGDVYRVTFDDGGEDQEVERLHHVGLAMLERCGQHTAIVGAGGYQLVVEGLFAKPGVALHGICSLAEATGEIMGVLAQLSAPGREIWRPKASTWRSEVLPKGWGRTSEEAERAALTATNGLLLPSMWRETKTNSQRLPVPVWPHVLEAACLARWGWNQQVLAEMGVTP